MTEPSESISIEDQEKQALNKRYETIGWGLFLIMIGGLWLVPDERIPEGTWLIGAGVIMLGLNLARLLSGIKMSGGTIVLGLIALGSGLADVFGADLPVFAILLIVVGLGILLKPVMEKAGIRW
jgi:hypothetical protein